MAMQFRVADAITGSLTKLTGQEQLAMVATAIYLPILPCHRLACCTCRHCQIASGGYEVNGHRPTSSPFWRHQQRVDVGINLDIPVVELEGIFPFLEDRLGEEYHAA